MTVALSMWRGYVIPRTPVPVACPSRARSAPESVKEIMREVASKHRVPADELLGPNRNKPLCNARFEAMARVRSEIKVAGGEPSFPLIGSWFGGRDHTTVMNAIRRHAELTSEAA